MGDEIANEMKSMLVKVGWKKDFIEKNTPVMPISGWMGDNLLKKSDNMAWGKGQDIEGGKEMEDPHSLKSNEMAQCSFQPQQPLVCDTFKNCEGLSRVAFMDGNGVVMLGKVVSCERKEEGAAGGKKK